MASLCNHRGFTRLDALVVGVVCLVLVLLAPILLAEPRAQSARVVCAANLSQIGKTMFVYANDHDAALPRVGGRSTSWGAVANWAALNRQMAYGLAADGVGGKATISASLFLLVKYHQAPTRLFVCPSDKGTSEFKLQDVVPPVPSMTLADAWDFGPLAISWASCSFAYHCPFGSYYLTTARDPNLAVAADRSPWFKSPGGDMTSVGKTGNTIAHGRKGQNVLFLDGRVTFETQASCGLDQDNIYTISMSPDKGSPLGAVPLVSLSMPINMRDSVLLHDPNTFGGTAGR